MTREDSSRLTWGIMLVVFGLVLLGRQLDVVSFRDFGRLWPLVFFVIAAGHLVPGEGRLQLGRAVWFAFLGTIFMLHSFKAASLRDTWPLFIVAFGVNLVVKQVSRKDRS